MADAVALRVCAPISDIDLASRHRRHQLTALSAIPDFEGQQDVAGQTALCP